MKFHLKFLQICSPTTPIICSKIDLLPGVCFNSNNDGKTWRQQDDKSFFGEIVFQIKKFL